MDVCSCAADGIDGIDGNTGFRYKRSVENWAARYRDLVRKALVPLGLFLWSKPDKRTDSSGIDPVCGACIRCKSALTGPLNANPHRADKLSAYSHRADKADC